MSPSSESLTQRILIGLWTNWLVAFGSVAVVLVLPLFMSKAWLPFVVVGLAYILLVYSRRESAGVMPGCVLTLRVAFLSLFWSAMVMELINILNSRLLFDGLIDWSHANRDIPYIVGLVVFPVVSLNCIWQTIRGYGTRFCRNCQARNGFYPGNGVVSSIYSRESRYQVALILYISLTLSVIEWWYYFCYYINVNMNTPDRFFFNYMPITIIVLSLVFMWMRYANLIHVIGPMAENEKEQYTSVRYLVLSGDYMLLAPVDDRRWDTPAHTELPPEMIVNDADARKYFARIYGGDDFRLRALYASKAHNMRTDVVHYAAFLPENADGLPEQGRLHGDWFSLDQIDRMLKTAGISAELADEIYRIFTITMAWKTYDRTGRRLYPIRHYRPTFRLRDFPDWDVDYGDLSWLAVADNNQDRPFFRTRRLWRRLTGL